MSNTMKKIYPEDILLFKLKLDQLSSHTETR